MAQKKSPNLDTLPVELLQRIAGFGPCSSALSLLRVNRTTRIACDDRLLFKHIAQTSHLGFLAEKWESGAFFEIESVIETEKTALAVEKAVNWCIAWEDFELHEIQYTDVPTHPIPLQHRSDLKSFRYWLPQLVTLHHPCALKTNPAALWKYLDDFRGTTFPEGFNALAFPFIASILEQNSLLDAGDVQATMSLSLLLSRAIEGLKDMRFVGLYRTNPGFGEKITDFVDTFPYHLSMAIVLQYINSLVISQVNPSGSRFSLPLPSKISFDTFMNVPRLLQDCEDETNEHLFPHFDATSMLKSDFMSSGEWIGYYSYDRTPARRVRFDPPMHSIRFETRVQHGVTLLTSDTGVDSVGSFTLRGQFAELRNGRLALYMTKTYSSAHVHWNTGVSWEWRAWVTPFGIVGAWGKYEPDLMHGYFWLWKREWSHEVETDRT